MHKVPVNRLGGLSLPRKSVVRLTDRPDMTLDVYRGRKTTKQQTFCYGVAPRSADTENKIYMVQVPSAIIIVRFKIKYLS